MGVHYAAALYQSLDHHPFLMWDSETGRPVLGVSLVFSGVACWADYEMPKEVVARIDEWEDRRVEDSQMDVWADEYGLNG